jgi:hypothetical protein
MAKRGIRIPKALVGVVFALWGPLCAAAEMLYHYDCRVTGTGHIAGLGAKGQAAELSHFTCRITGGLLHGFVATGTNILDPHKGGGRLLGSIVVAQKAGSALVYEVSEGTRRAKTIKGRVVGWESTGAGVYKSATGSAAPLEGKSFNSVVRSRSPGLFTIDVVVSD